MARLAPRPWVSSDAFVQRSADRLAIASPSELAAIVVELADMNRRLHNEDCVNLDPAANTMNPRAEALLAAGLGSRPSLGHPGDKYETGLEAIEQIEIVAAELAAQVFDAPYVEVRVGSGAMANLYAFMATCRPGDTIIAPPPTIGGHVTHHAAGAAGWFGLETVAAPVDADRYTVDVDALAALARDVRPALITIGGSLNLTWHPVAAIRGIADDVGATLLFDAAHLSGLIAGGAWPNPLDEGAHAMSFSTYKSLAGPPAGLLVTTDAAIAERVDAIAFPGLTANFDAGNTAALAVTLADWLTHGAAYAAAMTSTARRLAGALADADLPVHRTEDGATRSHAFAIDAGPGAGHTTAHRLRSANLLSSAIGLPHDAGAGVRIGVNEIVRRGIEGDDADELGELIARAWHADDPATVAPDVSAFRRRFVDVRYCETR